MGTEKKRIYVLEDNQDIREIIEFLLESENYQVSSFASVTDFKALRPDRQPDAFVLDVMLPDGNGIDVCTLLKSLPDSAGVPVLMMSANYSASDVHQACGAQDFIRKPFDIGDFVSRVDAQVFPMGRLS